MDQKFKNRRIFLPHTVWLFMQLCEKINNVTINTFDGMFQSPLPLPKGEKNARSTSHVNHSKALIFSRPLCLNIFFQVHPGWMLRCPYYDRHTHTRTTTPSMITKLFYSSPRGALTIYINFGNPPLFFQILYVCKIASHVCAGVRLYNHVF